MITTLSLTDAVAQLFNGAPDAYEISIVSGGLWALMVILVLILALLMVGMYILLVGFRIAIDYSDAKHQKKERAFDQSTNEGAGSYDGRTPAAASADSEAP